MAFGRGRAGGEPGSESFATTSSGAGDAGSLTAFIDQGSSFEGKLSFKDTVRIDGQFTGEITSENTLIVGEAGDVQANIRSKTVIVSGSVVGDIHAARKLVLHKTARVEGNVETGCLVVEEGAAFNGVLKMSNPSGAKTAKALKAVDGGAMEDGSPQGSPPR
jgi:cytoskeletal protein CcmA (bactofilin family)